MIDPIQVGPFSDHVTLLQVRTRRVSIPHRLVSIQTRFEPRPTQRNNERTCSYSAARPLKTRTIRAKQLLLINLERGGGGKNWKVESAQKVQFSCVSARPFLCTVLQSRMNLLRTPTAYGFGLRTKKKS